MEWREENIFSKSNGPMMAFKKIYMKDHRIAVPNKEKAFYHCHVDTHVYAAANHR